MSDRKRKSICRIEVNPEFAANIVRIREGSEEQYAIEPLFEGHADGVYTPEALYLVALEAARHWRDPAQPKSDFFRLCQTAVELVEHLEQGRSLEAFASAYPSVKLTVEQKQDHEIER